MINNEGECVMPIFKIPAPLRVYAQGKNTVLVSGATVDAALANLVTQYPQMKTHLFEGEKLRSFVNIFLGEDDIRFMDGIQTRVAENDILIIIPSIAGGAFHKPLIATITSPSARNLKRENRARPAGKIIFKNAYRERSYEAQT